MAAEASNAHSSRRHYRLPRHPNLYYERRAWSEGYVHVAGVDEAGRGAWAGPLVAAAVMLPRDGEKRRALSLALGRAGVEVNDSKKLSPPDRESVVAILDVRGIDYAIAVVEVADIDAAGVGHANLQVLRRAALTLAPCPQYVVSDAYRLPQFGGNQLALIKGDCRSRSVALASIVAKVARDRMMIELDQRYPGYGFARHKGYGTAEHRAALAERGPSPVHRLSFTPVRESAGVVRA